MGLDVIDSKAKEVISFMKTATRKEIIAKYLSSEASFFVGNEEMGIMLYSQVILNSLPKTLRKNQDSNEEDILTLKVIMDGLQVHLNRYWKDKDDASIEFILYYLLDLILVVHLHLCFYEHLPFDQDEIHEKIDKFDLINSGKVFKNRDQKLISFYKIAFQGYNALIGGNKIETQKFLDELTNIKNLSPNKVLIHPAVCWDFASFCGDKEMVSFYDSQYTNEYSHSDKIISSGELITSQPLNHTTVENNISIDQFDTLIFSESIKITGSKNLATAKFQLESDEHGTTDVFELSGEEITLVYFLAKEREQSLLKPDQHHIPWLKNPLDHEKYLLQAYKLIKHKLDYDMKNAIYENNDEYMRTIQDQEGNELQTSRILFFQKYIDKWPFEHKGNEILRKYVSLIKKMTNKTLNTENLALIILHPNYPRKGIYTLVDWISKVKFISTEL